MYQEFLDFIFPLAEGAGKIQLAYFRGDDLAIRTKSNVYDVVTRADKESEAYIVQVFSVIRRHLLPVMRLLSGIRNVSC